MSVVRNAFGLFVELFLSASDKALRELNTREAFVVWLCCMAGMAGIIAWCFLAAEWGMW